MRRATRSDHQAVGIGFFCLGQICQYRFITLGADIGHLLTASGADEKKYVGGSGPFFRRHLQKLGNFVLVLFGDRELDLELKPGSPHGVDGVHGGLPGAGLTAKTVVGGGIHGVQAHPDPFDAGILQASYYLRGQKSAVAAQHR